MILRELETPMKNDLTRKGQKSFPHLLFMEVIAKEIWEVAHSIKNYSTNFKGLSDKRAISIALCPFLLPKSSLLTLIRPGKNLELVVSFRNIESCNMHSFRADVTPTVRGAMKLNGCTNS